MKKALAILMVLALVASAATAEITFGAWGRTIFVPMANSGADGVDSGAKIIPSWDWGGPNGIGAGGGRIGATIAGNSDNVGFQIDLNGDGGSINGGDEQKVWVKPMANVKIAVGRAQDDALRGNAAFGSWNWYRAYGAMDFSTWSEDFTFSRLSTGLGADATTNNRQGVIVTATPMEALFLAVAFRDVNGAVADAGGKLTENLVKNAQYAAGYTIANVGQIRAQYIGQNSIALNDTINVIEVAFKITAVQNLYADIGYRMCTNSDVSKTKQISLYGNYKVNAATVHAAARINLNAKEDTYDGSGDMGLYVGAGVDYALDGGIGLAADVRYTNAIALDGRYADDARTTFFAGATKGFSNGLVGIGFEYLSATDAGYAIPVRFEYWF